MNWEMIPSPNYEIKEIRTTVRDSEVHLTWFWSKEIDFVYIYKAPADEVKPINEITEQDIKLYTRDEYKVNRGFRGRLDGIGRYAYRIFPGQKHNGILSIYQQTNDNNLIYLSGSKAKIYFSITYKNKLLQPKKRVQMSIMTELALDKDLLVYVKKRGAPPLSIEDGTVYPFVRDFPAGKTMQPEIVVGKEEYIRIFFSNGRKSAESFELIPE
ncbi:beta-mannanase [Neobacillus jeddahensis]|uniref:beta-mannanase n=1 Tax=Neobacillus jeddahensis TaxID=1461580 RepID=UPI0011555D81|nr:beta-mannanase [Neobacillus jeddahensis]